MSYDVVIAGGGPAGLSAALMLGRGVKRTLFCDSGTPRNAAADGVHGFVTRDGIPPAEFRRIAREQLAPYDSVSLRDARVIDVLREEEGLRVVLDDGSTHVTRRVLLAVGVVDELPAIPGMRELWGRSIGACPYCHGWEVRDLPWGVLAPDPAIAEWSLLLTGWTRDLIVFTQGVELPADVVGRLTAASIRVERRPVSLLIGDGHLEAIELVDGERLPRRALFLRPRQRPAPIVERLGLALDDLGFVRVDERKESSMPGVHVAGDATTLFQGALVAAAAGNMAAAMINHSLTIEAAVRGDPH